MRDRAKNEEQTVALAAGGDIHAVADLVMRHYRAYLRAVVASHFPGIDNDGIDEHIMAFYSFIISLTASGQWRLRNLNTGGSPRFYLAHALDNFLNDHHERAARAPLGVDFDEARADADMRRSLQSGYEPYDDQALEALNRKEAEIQILLLALESCDTLSPRDRYILCTFLLGERYAHQGKPLKLREEIARQLGENPSTVYNAYKRALERLRAVAQERLGAYLKDN